MSTNQITAAIARLTNTINLYGVPTTPADLADREAAIARREDLIDELESAA